MSNGYLFPEIPASGDSTPKRLARPLSAKTMAARFKEHLGHAGLGSRQFTFHSFRVGCAVTQTIAGKDIAEIMAAVNWKSEKIARRYVGGARATRDPTGTTPGAAEARYGATVRPTRWRHLWTRQRGPYSPQRQHPPAGSRIHRRGPPLQRRFLHREIFLEHNCDCTTLGRLAAFVCECWG